MDTQELQEAIDAFLLTMDDRVKKAEYMTDRSYAGWGLRQFQRWLTAEDSAHTLQGAPRQERQPTCRWCGTSQADWANTECYRYAPNAPSGHHS